MVGSNLTILDQIAKFSSLLSEGPSYWYSINTCCDHAFHLSKQLGMEHNEINKLLNKLSQILLCTIWTDNGLLIAVCKHSKAAAGRLEKP